MTITDRSVEGLVMTMSPDGDIPGHIRIQDAASPPDLSKLSIDLHTSAIYFAEPATVAKNLSFDLKDIAPAHFDLDILKVPESFFVKSIRYGGEEIGETGAEFVSGNSLEITLSGAAGSIEGTVADEGLPLVDAAVVLIAKGSSAIARVTTEADGTFRFSSLKPGEYRIMAVSASEPNPDEIESLLSKADPVTVEANGRQTVTLKPSGLR